MMNAFKKMPISPFLGIFPKECKKGYNRDTCTPMFISQHYLQEPSFGKKPRCPRSDEWVKKMQYTHTHTHTHTQWSITQP
jgi:hypothetical protein